MRHRCDKLHSFCSARLAGFVVALEKVVRFVNFVTTGFWARFAARRRVIVLLSSLQNELASLRVTGIQCAVGAVVAPVQYAVRES